VGINTSVRQNTGNDVLLRDFNPLSEKRLSVFSVETQAVAQVKQNAYKNKKGFFRRSLLWKQP
jgi:hypothetical protein